MPSAGEIMSMRGMGMPRTAGQSAVKRALSVQQKTPMIAGTPSIEGLQKSPKIASTARRMAAAYEKLEAARKAEADKLSPKTANALGKLILEFEQVNQNLTSIQGQIRQDITQKKRFYDEEKKLIKEEKDNLTSLRAGFFETRAKIAAFSAAVAGKALLEGRIGDAAQPAAVAVGAMLPEIVNIVSSLVLGRLMLGGRGGAAAGGAMRGGGMRMPGRMGMLGLGAAALSVPFMMGSPANAADQRRRELISRQTTPVINERDVDRFQSTLTRFDSILSNRGNVKKQEQVKKARGEGSEKKDGKDGETPRGIVGNVNAGDIIADTPEEKAFLATVREVEGTAGPKGYSTFFGGSQYGGDLTKKTINEVVELQKQFLAEGRGTFGNGQRSAAVGAGQFMKPEEVAQAMGRDPSKQLFDEEFQNAAMLFLARQKRGVDPSQKLTTDDLRKLNEEWSGLGPRYGQTTRTIQESLKLYEENLREATPRLSPKARTTDLDASDAGNRRGYGQDLGPQSMNIIPIPGTTNVTPISPPRGASSSSNVAFDVEFESVDRFQSKSLLGVYG